MFAARSLALLFALSLALAAAAPPPHVRARRQLADDNTLQPLEDAEGDEQTREKRKLEGVTQAKFGIKNAVLGFVFGKINSIIDAKTRLVDTLDRQNIAINKQYGIEAPQSGLANGLSSLTGIVGQVLGPKLQLLGPKIQAVSGLLGGSSGSSSGGSSGQEWHYIEAPGHQEAHEPHGGRIVVPEIPSSSYHYDGRHSSFRPDQGQAGLPGEPVWAFRVVGNPHH
ncbi:uncharacterized protein LOC113227517 isoform X1 [Hyposmocoma kahamanoa]|uniref:uncharacterized protein LOC113227517 isoform X1 n=1 Tax=Hyposmocoma kahamanoa TaxID=1477025 RepID=UPI000E6DA327|nr:uncharacterized protein LOC113227517 isoform X1 [Hyposmocoma kahamanoa]